jgi:type II secretory pathway component PulM
MSLNRKLMLAMRAILVALGIAYVSLNNWSNTRYYQEVTQRLNTMVARHVVAEERLFTDAKVNRGALERAAHIATVINPAIKISLLDVDGKILGHVLPANQVQVTHVEFAPLLRYLQQG